MTASSTGPTLGPTTPYYGGRQVPNPANVISTSGAPSSSAIHNALGTIAIDNANKKAYILDSLSGGTANWATIASGSGPLETLTGDTGTATASGGNIKIAGTASQVTTAASGSTVTISLPSAITAPGSLTTTTTLSATTTVTGGTGVTATTGNVSATAGAVNAGTSMTATLGNITATNGNLVLGTAGNKLSIATGSNASMGTATLNGSGTVTVATTAVKTGSTIFLTLNTPSSPGFISAPVASIVDSTQFVINSSSGTDASTVNWLIIN